MSAFRRRGRYGPWAVVTGASDGIGRRSAEQLVAAGYHVVLVARRGAVLEELARAVRGAGRQVRVVPADLGDPAEVRAVLEATAQLDVGLLVAAAGFGGSGPLLQADLDHELNMIDVNCRAVLQLVHGFGRRFAARRRGGIVLFSSLVAFQGVPRAANYAATKAYVQSLAEGLRAELEPFGVDVLATAPGPVNSGFAARADMKMGDVLTPDVVARGALAALGRRTTVRPGWLSKVLELSLSFLPRSLRVRILALVMHGMTKHQVSLRAVVEPGTG